MRTQRQSGRQIAEMTSRSKSRGYRDGASDDKYSKTPERNEECADEADAQDLLKEKNRRQKLAEMYKE